MNQNYYLVMAVYMKINPLRSKKKSRFWEAKNDLKFYKTI